MTKYEFTIMNWDVPIMHVVMNLDSDYIETERLTEDKKYQIFGFVPNKMQMFKFLEMRCFERTRPDMKKLLSLMGLNTYNPYEIVKKSHGFTYDDQIWIKFPGEDLTWKDVNLNGKF